MTNILISIIMPVYNDEQYVIKVLDSIKLQTLNSNSYEIIIVDDGSTDNTFFLCKEYLEKNNIRNFKLVNNRMNKGVSYSRNLGINLSKGKYLAFIDGDDLIARDYLKRMLQSICNPKVDLVDCLRTKKLESLGVKKNRDFMKDSTEMYHKMLSNTGIYNGYVTNKMFKSDVIKKNNLLFSISISYWEDMLFVEEYLKLCTGQVSFINEYLYFYRNNSSSMSNIQSDEIMSKNIFSKARVCQILLKSSSNRELRSKCLNFYVDYLLEYKCLYYQRIVSEKQYSNLYNYLKLNFLDLIFKGSFNKKIKVFCYMFISKI